MTENTHKTTERPTESIEDFTTSEGLRVLLRRLHVSGPGGWRRDPMAAELMVFVAEKYAPLARKHGLDPWEAASAAFDVMRTRAARTAIDPWAVVTHAVRITCIFEERAQGLLCSVHQARRPAIEWLPVASWWLWRSTGGQLLYRRRVVTPRPVGTLALPGDTARLREYTDPDTNAGMIHDPHQQTLTVVCEISHPAFVLLDPGEQERRVTSWGRVLATVCRSGRIATLQVLERTLPDSGTGLAEWWASHGISDDSWAATTYAELIDRAGPAGERHATTLSLSLDMKAAARQIRTAGGGIRGGAAVLRQEMSTLVAALRSADLTPSGWLTAGKIAVILRGAYDPAIAATLERHGELGQNLATAGPVAVNESWTRLRTDSAHHTTLWISEWPRSMVYPGFLSPVLLSTGVQRSFSLICTPMRSDQAARDIRKKKVEHISDAAQRAKIGQIEDAALTAEYQDVLQQEADLTAGHGVLRYTGLISVSAPTVDELEAAVAAIEQAAIQASCETRPLVGQQAAAFTAAALPLCRSV